MEKMNNGICICFLERCVEIPWEVYITSLPLSAGIFVSVHSDLSEMGIKTLKLLPKGFLFSVH